MAQQTDTQFEFPSFNNQIPDFSQMPSHFAQQLNISDYRFFRVDEITEHKASEFRSAMGNVLSTMIAPASQSDKSNIVYLLSGKPDGISLYLGLAGKKSADEIEQLQNAFEGNFLGAKVTFMRNDDPEFSQMFSQTKHLGVITGVPSFNEDERANEEDFQGVERLINTLSGESWQMIVVAETGDEKEVRHTLEQIYDLSTKLSDIVKYSVQKSENSGVTETKTTGSSVTETNGKTTTNGTNKGTNTSVTKGTSNSTGVTKEKSNGSTTESKDSSESATEGSSDGTNYSEADSNSLAKGENKSIAIGQNKGESIAFTREHINKEREQSLQHLNETQIVRFQQGLSKGMFRTAIYICATNQNTYNRLARSILSIFQGSQPVAVPLTVHKLALNQAKPLQLADFLQIRRVNAKTYLQKNYPVMFGIPQYDSATLGWATWLTAKELSLLVGLPALEVPGLKLRKSVSFALNTVATANEAINLGNVIQDGRELKYKPILLPKNALDKHIFITGVTGAGKTTTCMNLLLESGFPFTVIEPAKTEYRALHKQGKNIQYYSLGREDLCTFRLNPFELVSKHQNLTGHISMLKATMAAVFPMEASMPFIVEQAIIQAYQNKGWDIANNINYLVDDPWNTDENIFPTFSDMIEQLHSVIKSAKMGQEFAEKYEGSLVSRLTSLTTGIRGTMINTPRSIDFDQLLDQNVVIELEELKDEEDKAFFMGLIIGRLAECVKQRHRTQHNFRHITLIEEAHRLLADPGFGEDSAKKLGVDMFANLLAEVRKYGESLVIADQIPNKLISDVIKNTNTKIVHRLFAADDRDKIGDSMGLNNDQKDFLPLLQPGETVVYSGGWHAPVRAQIRQIANTTDKEIDEQEIQQQGEQQLWAQRYRLFPKLAQHARFTPQNFAKMLGELRQQLNMLLITLTYQEKKQDIMAAKIWQRFCANTQAFQQRYAIDNNTLSQLWLDLYWDTETRDIANTHSIFRNYADYPAAFQYILGHLSSEFAAFHQEALKLLYMKDFLKKFIKHRFI